MLRESVREGVIAEKKALTPPSREVTLSTLRMVSTRDFGDLRSSLSSHTSDVRVCVSFFDLYFVDTQEFQEQCIE